MFSGIKRLFKGNNRGVALILSLIVVSVLFIFASFLVRRVITNTMMVEKIKDEQTGYALAKEGILYAVDQLNNSSEATDWTPADDGITPDDGWYDYSNRNYSLKITTGNPSPSYITIESRDLPKKLVNLEGISNYTSPLLKYVRFINSDTTFGDNTFGDSESNTIIRGEAPFCILGDLTWEDGSTNNLTLTGDNIAAIYGKITTFDEPSTTLKINGNLPNSGYHYYTDPSDPSDPTLFDTADGHYFDLDHLPSSYDYSTGSPDFNYGASRALFWPHINEERYENLVGGLSSNYYINGTSTDESGEWYDITQPGWIDDRTGISPASGSTQSCTYSSLTAILIVLDGNGEVSGVSGQVGIDDGREGETANDGIITGNEWRPYPSNGIIYSSGNLRVCGVIGDDNGTPSNPSDDTPYRLTIVSGGTIYIESSIFKGTTESSLALLAKEYVTLNTTHRFINQSVVDSSGCSIVFPSNIQGEKDNQTMVVNDVVASGIGIIVLSLGQQVTSNTINLKNFTLDNSHLTLKVYASNDSALDVTGDEQFGSDFPGTGVTINNQSFIRDKGAFTFKHIKLSVSNTDTSSHNASFDAVEVPISEVNAFCFSQDKSWAVITGNVNGYPLEVKGTIAENEFAIDKERSSLWPNLTYVYDSNLPSNSPPELPPSVNLVSLKRR